jgi:hypothetical protein
MAKNPFEGLEEKNPFEGLELKDEGVSIVDALKRGAGLSTRALLTGVSSIPNMIGDAAYSLANFATDQNLPLPTKRFQESLTAIGLPEPSTPEERISQAGISAAAGGGSFAKGAEALAGGAQFLPVGMLQSGLTRGLLNMSKDPSAQAGAALLGGTAAGALQEQGASPAMQLGGAVLGGMIGPTGTGSIAHAIAQPYYNKQGVAGNIIKAMATDPDRAAINLQNYKPSIPGSIRTSAEASQDPGLGSFQSFMSLLDRTIGKGSEFTRSAASRLNEKLGTIEQNRSDISLSGVYGKLDEMGQMPRFSDPASRNAISKTSAMIDELGPSASDPSFLYNGVRKHLAEIVNKKYDAMAGRGLAANEVAAYKQIINSIDEAIEAGMPGYAEYRKQYAKLMKGAERRETLEKLKSKGSPASAVDINNEDILRASSWLNAVKQNADDVANLTKSQKETIGKISDDFRQGLTISTAKAQGSNTWANITMAHVIGRIAGGGVGEDAPKWIKELSNNLTFLTRIPNEQVQRLVIDAMRDPDLARHLLVKANQMSAKPLSDKLGRRAADYGIGGYQTTSTRE